MTELQWPRSQWPRLLMELPAEAVMQAAAMLGARYSVADVALPQAGLGLMQLRESAHGQRYFLGEIPLSTAHVELRGADGRHGQGAASVMHDDVGRVRAVAILDAALAARLPGCEAILPLLGQGAATLAAESGRRGRMLAATRVDFSLLGQTDAEPGDE